MTGEREMSEANEQTCSTMDAMAKTAAAWELGIIDPVSDGILRAWVRIRMQAYIDGGWGGEEDVLVEWMAMDLALDEKDARRLCDLAGWVKPGEAPHG